MAGNSHFMMLETNSSGILNLIHSQLAYTYAIVYIPDNSRYSKIITSIMYCRSDFQIQLTRVCGYKFTGKDICNAL